jgi:hypothetical protein
VGLISMGNQVTLLVQEDVTPVPQHGSIALLHARSQAITMNKAPNTPMGFRFISDAEVFGHVVTQVLIYLRRPLLCRGTSPWLVFFRPVVQLFHRAHTRQYSACYPRRSCQTRSATLLASSQGWSSRK